MTPCTAACQAPLSMGILQARILEWVDMPSSLGYLPNPRIKARFPTSQTDSLLSEPRGKPNITCTMFKFGSCFQYSAITFIKPLHLRRGYVDMVVHLMRNKPMCENLMCLYLASKVIKWSIKAFPEKQRAGGHMG